MTIDDGDPRDSVEVTFDSTAAGRARQPTTEWVSGEPFDIDRLPADHPSRQFVAHWDETAA